MHCTPATRRKGTSKVEQERRERTVRVLREAQERGEWREVPRLASEHDVWVLPSGRVCEHITGDVIGQIEPVWTHLTKKEREEYR